jgi:glycosyltransferase involved in cell wall biosynthesis
LDGAVEFPPHKLSDEVATINHRLDLFDPEFSAAVFDYEEVAASSVAAAAPKYPLIKTIAPGWDNEPRREGKGLVLHGATPSAYQAWLEKLVAYAAKHPFHGEKIICVNAWNEWAEGAFLEPDVHFGGAFLNATGRAICGAAAGARAAILLVGHDAQPHGAQMLLLHLARYFARVRGFDVQVLLLGAGALVGEYQQTATVTLTADKAAIARVVRQAYASGIRHVLVNSAAAARLVPQLNEAGMSTTLLIHEMPRLLAEYNLQVQARLGIQAAGRVVFSSRFAHRVVTAALDVRRDDAVILPQGNYQKIAFSAAARAAMRARLGIADDEFVVLGAGFADLRKGFDLFVHIARAVLALRDDVHFIWAGEIQPAVKTYLGAEIEAMRATGRFHLPGFAAAAGDYFAAADVFALTSREDPYPTVVLEALACGVPVVAFEESGGIPGLIRDHKAGAVAKAMDTGDFRKKLLGLLNHESLAREKPRLAALAAAAFSQADYADRLLAVAMPALKSVSVCVLNYNYALYLQARLDSIFAQNHPVAEVLFFDDASTDESVALAARIAQDRGREILVHANARNSGAVLAQWRRAVTLARGEYVWLAEADDAAEPEFLSRVIEAMHAVDAVIGFSDSRVIDAAGRMTAPNYQPQYREAGAAGLAVSGHWAGRDFAENFLAERNLIFNVSAVVWRRDALLAALDEIGDELTGYRIAGDWRLYLEILAGADQKIAYVAESLNLHRRHGDSATATLDAGRHEAEIRLVHEAAAKLLGLGEANLRAQRDYAARIKNDLKPGRARRSSAR